MLKATAMCAGIAVVLLAAGESRAQPAAGQFGLPAWETEEELKHGLKSDKYDDYRQLHPYWYAVTEPPEETVRPMAEYEPARAVMMRPSGSISTFHKGIIKGLEGHVGRLVIFHTPGQMENMADKIDSWGVDPGFIQFLDVEVTNSIWTRDYGPISHVTPAGHVGFTDFRYYKQRHYDDAIGSRLACNWGMNVFRISMSYEGGNFMADPDGTCYATEKIYTQNAGHSQAQIDEWMEQYLGCTQLVAVKKPQKLGTGHIDMFAKLMDDSTIILGTYDPAVQPENAQILDDIAKALAAVVTQGGHSLNILRIPLPRDESNVWYTYTNSLIVNDTVLVPVYSDFKELEAQALEVYATARPDLEIQTVNSDAIIPSGGAIHCVTMSVPAGNLSAYQAQPLWLCGFNEVARCDETGPCGALPDEGQCQDGFQAWCGRDGLPQVEQCGTGCGTGEGDAWSVAEGVEPAGEETGQQGCGCRLATSSTHPWGWLSAVLLLVLLASASRRGRRGPGRTP